MAKESNIKEVFASFEREIARLESKKHKTEADLSHLNQSIKALEKRQSELNRLISRLMAKDSKMGTKQVSVKNKLDKQTSKLEKLKMLYKDLKEV